MRSTRVDRSRSWSGWCVAAVVAGMLVLAPSALGSGVGPYAQRNLVSDQPGKAELMDPDLVNAWGLAFGPQTPAWVANNGSDNSTLYTGGVMGSPVAKFPLTVSIPGGAPTGMVFNGTSAFDIGSGMSSGPAMFIFSSEAGRITAWNQMLMPLTKARTVAKVHDAIFKGLAIAASRHGPRIYATDFHNRRVDVWNGSFDRVKRHAFRDPMIPKRYAPFGIDSVKGRIVVTYAKQDKDAEDDVAGRGHGFVDVFSTGGKLLRRFASRGPLNSPWGLVLAPRGFGPASGKLLIGNFGNGRINVYRWASGKLRGALSRQSGKPVKIPGLWALEFGNGVIGTSRTLLFTSGPGDESHGLFGELTPASSGG
jgi:uncharacterized protein (TIGR03118 family)